jgi:hypothetical protein
MTQLFVTLTSSDDPQLKLPQNGLLDVQAESDGEVLYAYFYGLNPNGGYYAPCAVRNVEFVYPAV